MNTQDKFLDLYSDYLLSSTGLVTATGLSELTDHQVSHDQITRALSGSLKTSADLWCKFKKTFRQIESEDAMISIDDSIEEKPYTDENPIVCWHYDHSQGRSVKGIQFLTALYHASKPEMTLPAAFDLVKKDRVEIDPKTRKEVRKSSKTKNEVYRDLLKVCVRNQLKFKYVSNDVWFASAENMVFIHDELHKEFVMPLKANRKVAFTVAEKKQHLYQSVESVDLKPEQTRRIRLEQVPFPLLLAKQVFKNEDGSEGILYLVTSDSTLGYEQITSLYQKRWKIEEYHKSIKQNASLEKSPTQTVITQTNHFFAVLWAYIKLERLKVKTRMNHFALKSKIYMAALKSAYHQLQQLKLSRKFIPLTA